MSRGALPGALFDTGGGALPGVPAETLANKEFLADENTSYWKFFENYLA